MTTLLVIQVIRDHLTDERCNRAVLDFFSFMDVGRRVPAEEDAVCGSRKRSYVVGGSVGGQGAAQRGATAVPPNG